MPVKEWEQGQIILPKTYYPTFRAQIVRAWNVRQEYLLTLATSAHRIVVEQGHGKRKFNYPAAVTAAVQAVIPPAPAFRGYQPDIRKVPIHPLEIDEIRNLLVLRNGAYRPPLIPKRKRLQILPISRSCAMFFGEAQLAFANGTNTAYWTVSEGPDAVRQARTHPIAKMFFHELDGINWRPKTGGYITSSNSLARDQDLPAQTIYYGPPPYTHKPQAKQCESSTTAALTGN